MNRSQSVFIFILLAVIVGAGVLARQGSSSAGPSQIIFPAIQRPTDAPVIVVVTATPTVAFMAGSNAEPPLITIPPDAPGFNALDLQGNQTGPNSAAPEGTSEGWNPPPMEVPIAHHPWDHYWLERPVAPNNNDAALPYYTFASDGPANDLRIHHGVDLANPIGVEVYAAGDGIVRWAGKGSLEDDGFITAYGTTVVIEHDFGYEGQPVYTLYAHLSAQLVETEQRVEAGQLIGLIGNTGQVSGPHVHFEVRIGTNRYNSVYNPLLWMAPYIGTGVIAGRVMIDDSNPAYDSAITLISRETGQVVYQTTSYAGGGIKSDVNWQETFVIPDVPEGRYLVTARHDTGRWSGEVIVIAGTTCWVEMKRTSTIQPEPTDENETPTPQG
jgi:hypothetical protein